MNYKSLEDLPLTETEKEKIKDLGLPNATALLAMIQAAPGEFEAFLGTDRARELMALLEQSASLKERAALAVPAQRFPISGAILHQKPSELRLPDYDVETRDRLFEQLQDLRRKGDSSPDTKRQIAQLEQSLNAMLEKR